jgi:hypothetical protein
MATNFITNSYRAFGIYQVADLKIPQGSFGKRLTHHIERRYRIFGGGDRKADTRNRHARTNTKIVNQFTKINTKTDKTWFTLDMYNGRFLLNYAGEHIFIMASLKHFLCTRNH